MRFSTVALSAPSGSFLEDEQIRDVISAACTSRDYQGKRVLMIVPDATRTCPLGALFKGVFDQIGTATSTFDIMIALGIHQPMSEEAICSRLEITPEERRTTYKGVELLNHEWDNPSALRREQLFPLISQTENRKVFYHTCRLRDHRIATVIVRQAEN